MEFEVLQKSEDFRRLREQGRTVRSDDVVVVYLTTECKTSRMAVVASRRVGGAVRRNRAKRLLREAHRRLHRQCTRGYELMLIARKGATRSTCRAIEEQLEFLYREAGILGTRPDSENGDLHAPA